MTGLLTIALTSAAAALSMQPANQAAAPVAIAQPLGTLERGPFGLVGGEAVLPETGLMLLVGGALVGLAAIVRRTTRTVPRDGA